MLTTLTPRHSTAAHSTAAMASAAAHSAAADRADTRTAPAAGAPARRETAHPTSNPQKILLARSRTGSHDPPAENSPRGSPPPHPRTRTRPARQPDPPHHRRPHPEHPDQRCSRSELRGAAAAGLSPSRTTSPPNPTQANPQPLQDPRAESLEHERTGLTGHRTANLDLGHKCRSTPESRRDQNDRPRALRNAAHTAPSTSQLPKTPDPRPREHSSQQPTRQAPTYQSPQIRPAHRSRPWATAIPDARIARRSTARHSRGDPFLRSAHRDRRPTHAMCPSWTAADPGRTPTKAWPRVRTATPSATLLTATEPTARQLDQATPGLGGSIPPGRSAPGKAAPAQGQSTGKQGF